MTGDRWRDEPEQLWVKGQLRVWELLEETRGNVNRRWSTQFGWGADKFSEMLWGYIVPGRVNSYYYFIRYSTDRYFAVTWMVRSATGYIMLQLLGTGKPALLQECGENRPDILRDSWEGQGNRDNLQYPIRNTCTTLRNVCLLHCRNSDRFVTKLNGKSHNIWRISRGTESLLRGRWSGDMC